MRRPRDRKVETASVNTLEEELFHLCTGAEVPPAETPERSMAPASNDFDFELIAAFIDGRLSRAERARAVKLLAESEAAFEVYTDAVRARRDLEAEGVIPIAGRRKPPARRWWLAAVPAAAAAILLVALLPTIQARRQSAVLAESTELILRPLLAQSGTTPAVLATAVGPGWEQHEWPVMRGGVGTVVESSAALRLGVRSTDLHAALAMGDRPLAARLAGEMVEVLRSVQLSETSRVDYEGLRSRIVAGDSIARITGSVSRAEQDLRDFLSSEWFGFGKWFGAGELAARAHSSAFFRSDETAKFLEAAIDNRSFGPEDVRALRDVAAFAQRGAPGNEFESVRQKFAELIRRHGG